MNEPIGAIEDPSIRPSAIPSRGVRRVFCGSDGLRAGWSLALYLLIVVIIQFLVNALLKWLHQPTPDELRHGLKYPGHLLISNGIPFVVVLLATYLVSRLERRPFQTYGLGGTFGAVRQFFEGVFWGAALLTLLVLALWELHLLVFDGVELRGFDAFRFGAEWAAGFLCVGLFEETATRGFVQFTLARGIAGPLRLTRAAPHALAIGFWTTAVLTSFLFGFGHAGNQGESPIGLVSVGGFGLLYTLSLWCTGSLWWAIGMHAAWDWAQSFLFGVADSGHVVAFNLLHSQSQGNPFFSGGLTGPEGSIYILPTLALGFVVIVLTLRPAGWPTVRPSQ